MLRAMSRAFVVVCVLALAGCPRPVPESKPPPKATPQQCAQVADHLVGLMLKNLERNDAVNETADTIRRVIDERCVQDGWGPEAHQCFTRLQSMAEQGKQPCEEFLSIQQRENIDRAIAEVFQGPGTATP